MISFLSSPEKWRSLDIQRTWKTLIETNKNLDSIYQSPQWFEHLFETDTNSTLLLGVAGDEFGNLVGVIPIRFGNYALKFDVLERTYWKSTLRTAFILGSQPMVPHSASLYERLFKVIWQTLPDCECIYMDSVPIESFLWHYLQKSETIRDHCYVYVPDGFRPYHSLTLPSSFEEFLSKFKAKTRNTLKRKLKKLTEYANGRLSVIRVDAKDLIQPFLEGAVSVAKNSWQQSRLGTRIRNNPRHQAKLSDIADRGLLRSYLLKCENRTCSFVLGYQFRDVFHYVELAYDQSFSKFSPGTVLLYLLIKDLIHHNSPKRINFGIGYASYKQEFGNVHSEDASVLLLRKTFANLILRAGHFSFRSSVRRVRKYVKKFKY